MYDKFRNRLILPVIDTRGDVVGFGSRVLDKSEPKYMNTPETPVHYSKRRVLYGLNLAKKIQAAQHHPLRGQPGRGDAAPGGVRQRRGLHGHGADGGADPAAQPVSPRSWCCATTTITRGQLATQRALELLNRLRVHRSRYCSCPTALVDGEYVKQDADDFIKFQGPEAFERLLSGSENGVEFRHARDRREV